MTVFSFLHLAHLARNPKMLGCDVGDYYCRPPFGPEVRITSYSLQLEAAPDLANVGIRVYDVGERSWMASFTSAV